MSLRKELTAIQREVLDFVAGEIRERGFAPSAREICARFGFRSSRSALDHLRALERKGFIRREANVPRGIGVVAERQPEAPPPGLPLLGRIAAGSPLLAEQNYDGLVTLEDVCGRNEGDLFCLRVQGDSMRDAGILDGDYVVVRHGRPVGQGEIGVAFIEDEATVKRVFFENDQVRLQPENPAFAPLVLPRRDPRLSLGGPVTGVLRRCR